MSEPPQPPEGESFAVSPPPPPPPVGAPETDGAPATAAASDHPEIPIGAAFAGGLVFALILKRLAR